MKFLDLFSTANDSLASEGRARGGVHIQYPPEEDTGAQEGEGVAGPPLREGGGMPYQRPLQKADSAASGKVPPRADTGAGTGVPC